MNLPGEVLRIGLESDSEPVYFINEAGQTDGLDYQIGKAVAKRLGIHEVEFVEDDYDRLPELLKAGEVDIIMGGYVPDDSIDGVIWSKGYLDFGLCMVVRQDSFLRNYRHLRNRKVAIYDDPAAERWVLDNIPGVKLEKFLASSGWFEAVQRREVDALIYDYPFAASEIKRYPSTRIVQFDLNKSHYAIGIAAGNPTLKALIDQALTDILASADYERWVHTYLAYTPASTVAAQQEEDGFAVEQTATEPDLAKPVVAKVDPEPAISHSTANQKAVAELTPAPEKAREEPPAFDQPSYVVKKGDSLSKIAHAELGSTQRWREIWELNKSVLANPNLLRVGATLTLPR